DSTARTVAWRFAELNRGAQNETSFTAIIADRVSKGTHIGVVAIIECKGATVRLASEPAEVEVVSAILVAVFALPESFVVREPIGLPLLDVRHEEYQQAVDRLEGLGIVHGYPDRTYRPDKHILRAEATKMLVLTADLKEVMDSTRIGYILAARAKVDVAIYNADGKKVATLVNGERQEPTEHYLSWNGRADDGSWVEPGQYEVRVTAIGDAGEQMTLSTLIHALPVRHQKVEGAPTFKDVRPTDWYAGYIAEAEMRKYVRGYPDGSFRPKRPLNRAEAAAMIVRALGLEERALQASNVPTPFEDDSQIPAWARGYIVVAATEAPKARGKLILGYPGNSFKALRPLSRAEAAAMMTRFLDRDVERRIAIAGALAPGVKLTINGKTIESQTGTFREEVHIKPGVNIITVIAQ
ncbi:MAG TPA: hypothetical protein EYP10_14440, partial [Armatimonadetes bacterium]|nr:hypothetical protein [Armatimonadota bacterium]